MRRDMSKFYEWIGNWIVIPAAIVVGVVTFPVWLPIVMVMDNNAKKKQYYITVLGGRGVGKTSLLATLYKQFERLPEINLQILPNDHRTGLIMEDKIAELEGNAANEIITGLGEGSGEKKTFIFELGLKGFQKEKEMEIRFTDYPGGWLRDEEQTNDIQKTLAISNVVLWVIDAAALMVQGENGASYFRQFNIIDTEKKVLYDSIEQSAKMQGNKGKDGYKKLILLVPLKSETWSEPHQARKLLQKIEENWAPFLSTVRQADPDGERFAVAITPVHTLGGMHFDRVEVRSGIPYFIFRHKGEGSNYQPRYGEQVLAYSLTYIAKIHRQLHKKSEFTDELDKLVKLRLEDDRLGFKVLHGHFTH